MATTKIKSTNIESGGIEHSNLANSGATAGTYGAAASIPVLTVTEKGIITAASTVAVAGVSNFTYSSGDETLTISTADGNTYEADISGLASETYVDTEVGNITSNDLDMGSNKILYSNVYSALVDLPSASSYHGMFAHVHATGKGYFAHAGSWVPLANESQLTGLATETYVDTAVSDLIDSSPSTLDTLNELAAALGDDPNFASTVSANIGTRALKTTTVSAGTGLSGGGDLSANRTINLANTSVVAGSYGSSSQVPVITVDAQGRITSASSTTINATTLDSLDSTQFLRSDTSDTMSGRLTVNSSAANTFIVDNDVISGANVDIATLTSGSGGGLSFGVQDAAASNPVWWFRTYANESIAIGEGFDEYVRFDGINKRVGIGTADPDYKLVIAQEDDVGPSIELHQASNKKVWINNAGPSGHGSGRANRFEVNGTTVGHIWLGSNRVTLGSSVGDGSETLTVLGSSVGIGTTSPDALLHVQHTAVNEAFIVANRYNDSSPASEFRPIFAVAEADPHATGTTATIIGNHNRHIHIGAYFGADGSTSAVGSLTVLSTGNVGISTASPAEKLEVNGSLKVGNLKIQDADGGRIGFNRNTANGAIYDSNYAAFQINGAYSGADYLDFQYYTSGGTGTSAMVIDDNGNVGIGTTSPSKKLHVKDTVNHVATFETTQTSDMAIELKNSQGSMFFGLGGGEEFAVGTDADLNGPNSKFVIKSSGNVGIDTTSPTQKLHVNYTGGNNTVALFGSTDRGIYFTSDNAIISKGVYYTTDWQATSTTACTVDMDDGGFSFKTKQSGITVGQVTTIGSAQERMKIEDERVVIKANKFGLPVGSSNPSNPVAGDSYFNTADNSLKIYDGSAWASLAETKKGTVSFIPFENWSDINAAGALVNGEGQYWVKFSGMTSAIEVTISPDRAGDGNKNVIRIFQGDYAQAPTTNIWNSSNPITFRRLIVQRTDESVTGWAVASTTLTNGTSTGSSGTSVSSAYTGDVKIILHTFAGGFGIYRNNQVSCSWSSSNGGSIGAGYNGSTCNTYLWGTGTNGGPSYTNASGNWSIWIGED